MEPLDWARVPTASLSDARLRKRMKIWETTNARAGREVTATRLGDDLLLEAWDSPVQARSIDSFLDHPGLTEQIAAALGFSARPWRVAGIKEALGVPAINRAVRLLSNLGGSLSMEAFRKGSKLDDDDRPRVIVRPDPFKTPRDFYRNTIYNMATRGEAWWWIAMRDMDDQALSILNVPPQEVRVEEDPNDLLKPKIYWRDRLMRNEDMRQITLMQEPGELRGYGPLQVCGAAVSIAVESQEWAANFFAAGGYPNIWIKAAGDLSGGRDGEPTAEDDDWMSEVDRLKAQWIETAPNTPRITDEGIIDIKQFDPNPQGSQMLSARDFQNGDAARMFGIPGAILEYSTAGSSLTYQNLAEILTTLLRTTLLPDYLEPVEQTMSDLLTRSTVARFNVKGINRADIKTRADVYKTMIESGVMTPEMAQEEEGYLPGDVETAPVPLAVPQAIPTSLPVQVRSEPSELRCDGQHVRRRAGVQYLAKCNRLLSTSGQFVGACPRCGKQWTIAA